MAASKPRQQLLLVRDFYNDAERAAGRDDNFSTSKGILFLDLAVEQMLLTIITALPTKVTIPKGELKWDQLWQTASDVMAEHGHALPGKAALRNLHQDRNRVQHAGATFHFTQARKYVGAVQHMLATTFQDAFNFDFENFREWDLVSNEDLRRWLQHYEDQLRGGNPVACIAGCVVAYGRIVYAVREKTARYPHRRDSGNMVKRYLSADFSDYLTSEAFGAVAAEFEDLQKDVEERLDLLESELVALGVGMPVMDTRRFISSYDGVHVANFGGGKLEVVTTGVTAHEKYVERAAYMLNYLSRLIRLIEEGHPGALDDLKLKLEGREE
jgi:hypothetical protein